MSQFLIEVDQLAAIHQTMLALTQQVQTLGEQVQYLTAQAQANARRQQQWDDLQADLAPILKDLYSVTVSELAGLQDQVQLEDAVRLLKRLIRNISTFEVMLAQLESANDLLHDVAPLTREMMDGATENLVALERKGYFAFARQFALILDEIVTSFSEEDVRQLGQNVVLILDTIKAMTQPEIMTMMQHLTSGLRQVEQHPEAVPASYTGLVRQLRDPEVRRGLSIALTMLKTIAHQPAHDDQPNGNAL
jgi:uncharacterized protein YjgD (DUF1641 family)